MDIDNYKNNAIPTNYLQLLYHNDLLKYNFSSEDKPVDQENLDFDEIRYIINLLIQLQIPPITRSEEKKCQEARANIIRLKEIFISYPNHANEIVQTINEIISQTNMKEFYLLVDEYIKSDISPHILVEILHLIYSIMICPKSFYMPLFNDRFIDFLSNIIDQPENENKPLILGLEDPEGEIYDEYPENENKPLILGSENPEGEIYDEYPEYENRPLISGLENPEGEIYDEYPEYKYNSADTDEKNPFMRGFDEITIPQARTYASLILKNFFESYVEMNDEEKSLINLPDFESTFTHIMNGVYKTTQVYHESYSSQFVLFLLLLISASFKENLRKINEDLFHDLVEMLISCAKNPMVIGIEYALRLLFILNTENFIAGSEVFYIKNDFDEIFFAATKTPYEYHWELLAFIHSIFFSGNENAIMAIMESLESSKDFDLVGFLKFCSEEKSTFYFCYLCRDLLQLLFLKDQNYSKSENEFIQFFDNIGLIESLAKMAYESDFKLKREAVFAISSTSYRYDINLMRKLVTDFNFIELLTSFISLDFQILISSISFVYKILTIVNELDDENARVLLSRLIDANIFDEMEDSINLFDLPDPRIKYRRIKESKKVDSEEEEEEEEEEDEQKKDENAENSFKAKLLVSTDLYTVLNFKKEQCERLFKET